MRASLPPNDGADAVGSPANSPALARFIVYSPRPPSLIHLLEHTLIHISTDIFHLAAWAKIDLHEPLRSDTYTQWLAAVVLDR